MFEERDRIRRELSAGFLHGHGAEIAANAWQQLPAGASSRRYSLRTAAELRAQQVGGEVASVATMWRDFPQGADFLIAYNVLEHVADPIGTLIGWHRAVRDGGTVVLSLPDKNACHDAARREPPFSHLLEDYLLDRGAHAFESREHVLSFCLTWPFDAGPVPARHGLVSRLLARLFRGQDREGGISTPDVISATLFEPAVDIHWHAFTPSLAEQTVLAACELGGCSATVLARADSSTTPVRTLGDMIMVYELRRGGGGCRGFTCEVTGELRAARTALRRALSRIDQGATAGVPRQ